MVVCIVWMCSLLFWICLIVMSWVCCCVCGEVFRICILCFISFCIGVIVFIFIGNWCWWCWIYGFGLFLYCWCVVFGWISCGSWCWFLLNLLGVVGLLCIFWSNVCFCRFSVWLCWFGSLFCFECRVLGWLRWCRGVVVVCSGLWVVF